MRSTITLNGINSNTIEGLLIQNLPPISKPLMRTQIEEIDGRDGDVITKLGFSAYNKEITIGLYGDFDINQIIQYFTSQGTVVFSNEPDKYYYYQIIDQIDFERLIRYRTATVTMHCQPFKYSTTEGTQVFDNTSNLLTIPNSTTTKNGVTVTVNNNILTISGTGTAATEFYIPIDTLSLSVGKYGMYALGSGTSPEACSLRVINDSPSNANSFGGNYVTLKNNQTVSLIANLSNAKTYNYVYLYIAANKAMDFTLNLSIEDAAQSVVTGEGNLITLEGTAFAPFDKFDLKGDTTQQTYSGKNLLNVTGLNRVVGQKTYTNNNVTFTLNDDGSVTCNGTASGNAVCFLAYSTPTGAGTYYYSANTTDKNIGWTEIEISVDGGNKQYFGPVAPAYSTIAANSSINITYVAVIIKNGQTVNDLKLWSMLQKGAYSADYEPYVGGIPAPNPDYPQAVQVVTGEQTVTITDGGSQSQEYEVNLGKNLFDKDTANTLVGAYPDANTIIGVSGSTATTICYIQCEPNATYTVQKENSGANNRFVAFTTATTPALNTSVLNYIGTIGGEDNSAEYTITTPANAHFLGIFFAAPSGATTPSAAEIMATIQIKETATTELCKIGDYQDYIYKSGNDWYVHKATGKIVLGYSQIWSNLNTKTNYILFETSDVTLLPTSTADVVPAFSDKFKVYSNEILYVEDSTSGLCASSNGYLRLNMPKTAAAGINSMRTWCENNTPSIYYALGTATDVKITDATLISQLEALVTDAHAYKNTTTLVSTSQQLPHIMSVEVAKNNDATITNSGNTTAKPVMTVYGSGTVGIYLNGNQIFNVNIGNNQYITIDTANMEAYKDTTDNLMNRLVDGDYSNFVLQTGENQISFSGSVSKLEISNYSRWI